MRAFRARRVPLNCAWRRASAGTAKAARSPCSLAPADTMRSRSGSAMCSAAGGDVVSAGAQIVLRQHEHEHGRRI